MKRFLFVVSIQLLLFNITSAQIIKTDGFDTEKQLRIADKSFEDKEYYDAVSYYEEVFFEQPENARVAHRIAKSYHFLRDYVKAEEWYRKVMDMETEQYPLAPFYYAQMLKYNAKYEQSKQAFERFIKEYQGEDAERLKNLARREIEGIEIAIQARENPEKIEVENAGVVINTAYIEIAPTPMNNKLIFSALPSDTIIKKKKKDKNKFLIKLYETEKINDAWTDPEELTVLNSNEQHTANATFDADNNKLYFTRCDENDVSPYFQCEIFVSENIEDSWSDPVRLGNEINLTGSTNTQPSVGKAGDKKVLYFVSNRPDGHGGLDIWYAPVNEDGSFGEALNAGKIINTSEDDITPFYDEESNQLYFSSNGRVGYGGFDIYSAAGSPASWETPEILGMPLNSSVDDLYFVLDNNMEGYLVSKRPGGSSVRCETCCDDIYHFEYAKPPVLAINGFVLEEGDTTETPINDAIVHIFKVTPEKDSLIASDTTSDNKPFLFNVNAGNKYKLTGAKNSYFKGQEYVSTEDIKKSDTIAANVNLYLKKIEVGRKYTIGNIYYDFDKSTLRPKSKETLDTLAILLREYPNVKIEIGAHTDNVGTESYNKRLSQRRAESVVRYLISKGVNKDRLVAKGYGEAQPIAPNTNPDGTDNPQGRQLNRRTEFKILGKLDENVDIDYIDPSIEEAEPENKELHGRD